MPSIKPKAAKIARRMLPDLRKALGSNAKAVGELVWAYNHAQSGLATLFAHIVSKEHPTLGRSIWLAPRSDQTQRDILIAALETWEIKPPLTERMRKNLVWAARKIDKLATIRNDAVHMSSLFGSNIGGRSGLGVVVDARFTPKKRVNRLTATNNMNQAFRVAKADLWHLAGYVTLHYLLIEHPDSPFSLPRRPRLRFPQARTRA